VRVAVPVDDERVTGLLLHEAETPGGKPVILRFTGELKDPPTVIAKASTEV
jgi:hypothetical protein